MREEVDVSQFMTQPAESKAKTVGNTYGYAAGGVQVERDAKGCLAYAAGTRRFVMTGTHGLRAGRFFNPAEDDAGEIAEVSRASGRKKFEFRLVSDSTYELYVRFLSSGNPSYLLQAEREK